MLRREIARGRQLESQAISVQKETTFVIHHECQAYPKEKSGMDRTTCKLSEAWLTNGVAIDMASARTKPALAIVLAMGIGVVDRASLC